MTQKLPALDPPPPWLLELAEGDGGAGLSHSVLDCGIWNDRLGADENTWRWIEALVALDASGGSDVAGLVALLRSGVPLTELGRWFVADVLERYDLSKHRTGPTKIPAYERSDLERRFEMAKDAFKQSGARGQPARDDMIAALAHKYRLNVEALHKEIQGRRGAAQRRNKRLPSNRPM